LEVGYSEWRQVIWNQLDAVILCVYFLSFTIRAIGPSQFINQEDAKVRYIGFEYSDFWRGFLIRMLDIT
jgi:hypothetical protein